MIRVIKNPTTNCFYCNALLEYESIDIETMLLETRPELRTPNSLGFCVGQITCPQCGGKSLVCHGVSPLDPQTLIKLERYLKHLSESNSNAKRGDAE